MRPESLDESELDEQFTHASGPGGQNVNKVATRVVLRHIPTGIVIAAQDSRAQSENRKLARERLLAALQERERRAKAERRHEQEKRNRAKRPRPRRLKQKILEGKRRRSRTKALRQNASNDSM